MRIKPRLFLTLFSFSFFCVTTSYAQININVEIHGVNTEIEKNIRLYLSIEQQKSIIKLDEYRLRLLHRKAEKEIRNALQPFGYYAPSIKSTLIKTVEEQWLAKYTIDIERPLIINQYDFKISTAMELDPEFIKIVSKYQLSIGDIFNHIEYEKFKNELVLLAAERGYFKAEFIKHKVEVNLETYTANIQLHFMGGERYHFGEVYLNQDILDPELIKRYIPFKKGEPYTFSKMLELQQSLNDSDYFRTVEVSPKEIKLKKIKTKLASETETVKQVATHSNEVPVAVELTPRKRHKFSIGGGFGTDTGVRAKFGWEIPRLNRKGHRVNTDADISERGYSFSVQYKVPVFNPRTDQIIYSTSIVNKKTVTSENTVRSLGGSLNYSRGLWRESIYLNYQEEDFIIANEFDQKRSLIPGISWNRKWGNDLVIIFDGLRFDTSVRGASDNVFSDTSFIQTQGSLKGITPLGNKNRIIAYGRLGFTEVDDINELPKSLRFFAGGANSVRGYAYESLGPVNDQGEVIGGKYLMIGSLEFEHSLTEKWGAAVFIDAGNAFNDLDDKLARGIGAGIRWRSPIGPVRLDIANAVLLKDRPWRVHITIGPDL